MQFLSWRFFCLCNSPKSVSKYFTRTEPIKGSKKSKKWRKKFTCCSLPQPQAAPGGLEHLCLDQTQPCAPASFFVSFFVHHFVHFVPRSNSTLCTCIISAIDTTNSKSEQQTLLSYRIKIAPLFFFDVPFPIAAAPPHSIQPQVLDFSKKTTNCRLHVLVVVKHPPDSDPRAFQGFGAPSGPPPLVGQVETGRAA